MLVWLQSEREKQLEEAIKKHEFELAEKISEEITKEQAQEMIETARECQQYAQMLKVLKYNTNLLPLSLALSPNAFKLCQIFDVADFLTGGRRENKSKEKAKTLLGVPRSFSSQNYFPFIYRSTRCFLLLLLLLLQRTHITTVLQQIRYKTEVGEEGQHVTQSSLICFFVPDG